MRREGGAARDSPGKTSEKKFNGEEPHDEEHNATECK